MAHFGKFPFGRELYGKLVYTKETGCTTFNIKDVQKQDFPYITLLDSGACDIRLKTYNAQNAGAELVIIVRKKDENLQDMVDSADSQLSLTVDIPTLIVTQDIGDKLKSLIKTMGAIKLKFQMPIPQSDILDIEFRIKDTDLSFYGFLSNFKNSYIDFEQRVVGSFRFYKEGDDADEKAKMEAMTNCIDKQVVFDVLGLYGSNCAKNKLFTSTCLKEQINSVSKNMFVNYGKCYNSFNIKKLNNIKTSLKDGKNIKKSSILINNFTYLGTIKPTNVFEAMCGGFLQSPDNCLYIYNKYSHSIKYNDFRSEKRFGRTMLILVNIVVLLCLLIIAGAVMVIIFGKIYRRILNEKVASMVKESIDNYQTLKENV